MDVRHPLNQIIASILMGVMFLNPIVTRAAELTLDAAAGGNASLGQAANGVPLVNIATPNASGLSHNKFTDYNVGQQGLILNNSAQALAPTQLGGYIVGNPNLAGGAAGLILNEVTGSNASRLEGYTEVAGQAAHVIVANPHGITCDGCGFINTPKATLTTGTPQLDSGALKGYDVNGGRIAIEGAGLNAGNVGQFELITRAAEINAQIHAQQLAIVTGRNEVDAQTLAATAKADDGSTKPSVAIDSSALGGMYAGAIRLVGTEAGVGVKLAGDLAASGGDIRIDANGQLSMARSAAAADLVIKAQDVTLQRDTFAAGSASIETSRLDVQESLAAGNRVEVTAQTLNNPGTLEAGVRADGSFNASAQLQLSGDAVNNGGKLISHGSLQTDLKTLNNPGEIAVAGNAQIKADAVNNSGQLIVQQSLAVEAGTLNNSTGEVLAGGKLDVTAGQVTNQSGTLAANGAITLDVNGALNNTDGLIETATLVEIDAGKLTNSAGQIRALGNAGQSRLSVAGMFDNDAGRVESANAQLKVESAALSNQGGSVRHLGNQGLLLSLEDAGAAGGSFITEGELILDVADWSNSSLLQASRMQLNVGRFNQTATGQLLSASDILISGDDWHNDGKIAADGALSLDLSGAYSGNGQLLSQSRLDFSADSADFGVAARIQSAGDAQFILGGSLVNRGVMTADGGLHLGADTLDNRGTLGSTAAMQLVTRVLENHGGLIFTGAELLLLAQRMLNQGGDLYAVGNLSFVADAEGNTPSEFRNLSGTVESEGDITVRAQLIENARQSLDIVTRKVYAQFYGRGCDDCSGDKENVNYRLREIDRTEAQNVSARGNLLAGGNLKLDGQTVENRYSLMGAGSDVQIDAVSFKNLGAETGETVTERRVHSFRYNSVGFIDSAVAAFNARHQPVAGANVQAELNAVLGSYFPVQSLLSTSYTPDSVLAYGATVQAGGDVRINASQIGNGSIEPSFSFVSGGTRVDTGAPGSAIATQVSLNPQLPPDLAQRAVDPLALPGFALPSGQNGLFSLSSNPGHPYLIETNPAFASLGGFLSSDYMLDLLGYSDEVNQRRLGDGLYEQRLIREAILARTGKRFLVDVLTTDEAQFRYLMDNAIASKEALQLSVGVALSSEQVAALTHDIVWMEEREVAGERVLVPVLYLAQTHDRLAPSGALIQGRDVALISGSDLNNSGTLRASRNLDMTALGSINNSGLAQADARLSLLAGDSIRNTQGGILKGKDVSLVAVEGDVINERSITVHQSRSHNVERVQSFVGDASRIEAEGDLRVSAGRDLLNIGGALSAAGNADLQAGRDLIIASAEAEQRQDITWRKGHAKDQSITQYGSEVQIGGDLNASAGGDLAIVASTVRAGGDIGLYADGDITIASAANSTTSDYRHKGGDKKVERQESQVRQQSAVIEAGGNLEVLAGGDLTLMASKLSAGNEAYFYASQNLNVLAAENSDYFLYDMSKKGGWGSKETRRDEVTRIRNVGTTITTGGDLSLESGGDQRYQRARLESGGDIVIDSDGRVVFEAVKDLDQESHEKSKNGALWTSMEGEGWTDETVLQSQLIAKGELMIRAAEGLQIDLKEIDQHTVSQTIDVMVQADPELAWLKEMDERGDVDWRLVKEIHDQWDYEHSGLGGVAALIIAIIVTYLTAGAGAGLVGAASGTWQAAMANTLVSSVASNAAVSTINNRGDMGAVFKDVTSSEAMKGYAYSVLMGGGSSGADPASLGFNWASFGQVGTKALVDAGVKNAIYGGSFKDNLVESLLNSAVTIAAARGASAIGDIPDLQNGSLPKVALHAALGGLMAEAMGGDFRSGAIAAGANELLTDWLGDKLMPDESRRHDPDYQQEYQEASRRLLLASQLAGVLAAAATDSDPNIGMAVAVNATQNNFLRHTEVESLKDELDRCGKDNNCADDVRARYWEIVDRNKKELAACQENGNCSELYAEIKAGEQAMQKLGMWNLDDKTGFAYNQQGDRLKAGELKLIEATGRALEKQEQDRVKEEARQKQYDKELLELAQDETRWSELRRQEALQAEKASIQQELDSLQKQIAEANLSAAETDLLYGELRNLPLANGARMVATGGMLISEVLEPDAWDLLGPGAKAAKLFEMAAVLKKAGSADALQLSAKVEDAAKLTERMANLEAGKVSDAALAKHYGGLPSELALKQAQMRTDLGGHTMPPSPGKPIGGGQSGGGKPIVELFGGQNAQTPGAINVDIRPDIQSGIKADARQLPFRDNSLGEVVASNPYIPKSAGGTYSMMDFLPEAARVVEPGGKVFINVNGANPYGNLPSVSELQSLGLRVVQDGPLDSRFSGHKFLRTDGSDIDPSSMRTIVLEKSK